MSTNRATAVGPAVVLGNHLNAYGIHLTLRAAGWEGRVVFVKMAGEGPGYEALIPDVETWSVSLSHPDGIAEEFQRRLEPGVKAFLFLTDERYHEALLSQRDRPVLRDAVFHLGPRSRLDVVLDRHAFYRFLEGTALCSTPRTIDGGEDPWAVFRGGFILRFKRSWDGFAAMDRVRIVDTRDSLDALVRDYRSRGLTPDNWCYQEILSTDPLDNISVCGWHGAGEQIYRVTRPLARHPPQKGTALICEFAEGFESLQEITRNVLEALEFEGPFEMEFVRDTHSGIFKAIELNPRFWLQHPLMQQATGYAVTRRYLGLPPLQKPKTPKRSWVNTVHALARLPLGDRLAARHLLDPRTMRAPDLRTAVRSIAGQLGRRLLQVA